MKAELPVGFQKFHKNKFFNFQLNRWYSLGYTRMEDIQRVASGITDFNSYCSLFLQQAEQAVAENRFRNAAFYYRAAEFLLSPSDPDKIPVYDKFTYTFYRAFAKDNIERHKVPYENGNLPAMRLAPSGKTSKGTIVIHGGFDSFIEEWYCFYEFFTDAGYDVIAFEGPGQGAALRKYGLAFDHDWEKPVKAILDYFKLTDVTILGISMGGYWCLRAAAFEKRIKRVIAFPPLYDWMEGTNGMNREIVEKMMKWKWLMRKSIVLKMRMPDMEHIVNHTLFITNKSDPLDVVRWELAMNKENLHSDLVDQDVLLLAGEKDSFQPVTLYYKQIKALTNAKSVTGRIFTVADQAENHCGIGNIKLPMEVMLKWLEEKKN